MFLGHFAVGFALKRAAPRTSLGTLVAAAQFLDLLWPWFLLLGWERVRIVSGANPFTNLAFESYPISHSLVMAIVWGALFGGAYFIRGRATVGTTGGLVAASVWIAIAVISHWVLDWITHVPDLPIAPWSPGRDIKVGLGLWRSVPGTLVVESALFAAGVWIYARTTRARDRMGAVNFWIYVVALVVFYAASIIGPPPPDPHSLAIFALALWLLPPWAAWVDKHRSATRY
jgi:hypothetical protein